jgi:hypothetical protein
MPELELSFEQLKQLLLLLCRYPFDEKNREDLSKLLGAVKDWHKMAELINAHGIIALAAYNIREAGLEKIVPEEAMSFLDNGRMKSMARNTWLTERWKEVNTILENAGIKHVLLKGMALEHTLYGSKGLRQMNDNDILVKRDDALKAWYLLKEHGFSHELIKSPLHKKIMIDTGKHLPCLYKNGFAIEIHHKLYDTKPMDKNSFYDPIDYAAEFRIGDTKSLILPKNIQLKYLINHLEKHALQGDYQLRLYADIVLLDKTSTIRIPDCFILNPQHNKNPELPEVEYKASIRSLPAKYRLRYVIGDIFPSIKWMKKRHNCNLIMALFFYPGRLGKLIWLL